MLALFLGQRAGLRERAVYLSLVAAALLARASAGEPLPPRDPTPALLEALQTAAAVLDADYAKSRRYQPDVAALDQRLAALPSPGFVHRAQLLAPRSRLVEAGSARSCAATANDVPGTVVIAVDANGTRAWFCALTLVDGRVQPLQSVTGPLLLQARAGTHSAPGRDPLLPAYPGMHLLRDKPPSVAR